jgi:hypothetical protein
LACRTGRAADRTFDESRTCCSHRAGKRGFSGRQDGAHVDEELSGDVAVKKTGTAIIDRIQGRRIGKDAEDGFAFLRQLRRGCRDTRAGDGFGFFRRAIPDRHVVADLNQPRRNGSPHLADTELHTVLPAIISA